MDRVLVVQYSDKEMYKRSVLHVQSSFFCYLDLLIFLSFLLPSRFSITRFYFLFAWKASLLAPVYITKTSSSL